MGRVTTHPAHPESIAPCGQASQMMPATVGPGGRSAPAAAAGLAPRVRTTNTVVANAALADTAVANTVGTVDECKVLLLILCSRPSDGELVTRPAPRRTNLVGQPPSSLRPTVEPARSSPASGARRRSSNCFGAERPRDGEQVALLLIGHGSSWRSDAPTDGHPKRAGARSRAS